MKIGVLIVDDQEDIRSLMRIIIDAANSGMFVSGSAASGVEALDAFEEADPTVVVLDQMMPEMNGIELARAIRARRPNQLMVLCSAYLDRELRSEAEAAGIQVCLNKEQVVDLPLVVRKLAEVA